MLIAKHAAPRSSPHRPRPCNPCGGSVCGCACVRNCATASMCVHVYVHVCAYVCVARSAVNLVGARVLGLVVLVHCRRCTSRVWTQVQTSTRDTDIHGETRANTRDTHVSQRPTRDTHGTHSTAVELARLGSGVVPVVLRLQLPPPPTSHTRLEFLFRRASTCTNGVLRVGHTRATHGPQGRTWRSTPA
jgi:hypothetical protein